MRTEGSGSDPLTEHATRLRATLDQERARKDELTAALDHCQSVISRAEKALVGLEGQQPKPKPTTAAKSKRAKQAGYMAKWTPSIEMMQQVEAAVTEHYSPEDDITTKALAERVHASNETIRRALEVLREREVVRLVRAPRHGRATTWRLMPHGS